MSGPAARSLALLLIVSGTSACDNVEWGGFELRLQGPPSSSGSSSPAGDEATTEAALRLPDGPVLYLVERDDEGLRMVPVGGLAGDSIVAFPPETAQPGYLGRFVETLLPPGSEFVLFAEGVRAGRFTVATVDTDDSFCVPRPVARGWSETIPEAVERDRFLALPLAYAGTFGWRPFEVNQMDRAQRDASLSLPGQLLSELGAERSPNLLDMRWNMEAFRPHPDSTPLFTVTHLFRDRLTVERPPATAYSLFVLGIPGPMGYEVGHVWYRPVAQDGKGAPRFFESLDWTGDGRAEVLLEVMGESRRWTAALSERNGVWTRVHEDPCGSAAPAIGAGG